MGNQAAWHIKVSKDIGLGTKFNKERDKPESSLMDAYSTQNSMRRKSKIWQRDQNLRDSSIGVESMGSARLNSDLELTPRGIPTNFKGSPN